MAHFVLINEICRESWLVWTTKDGGSCLRDYRTDPLTEYRQFSTSQIKDWLNLEGNYQEQAPYVSVKKTSYWREQQRFRNFESGLERPDKPDRLLNLFKKGMKEILRQGDLKALRFELDRWKQDFDKIVRKEQFNHWDNDDAKPLFSPDTGIGWTATMLERCRVEQQARFINTNRPNLDFSLIAMELSLGLSSAPKQNPFQPGKIDFIKPDGLGVRRDGSICVIEVKGPQDDGDPLEAMLQGLCGALAVFSKREMIVELGNAPVGRRPKLEVKKVPKGRRTLGVYVLISANHFDGHLDDQLGAYCDSILKCFPELREIAYFSVKPSQCADFSELNVSSCRS